MVDVTVGQALVAVVLRGMMLVERVLAGVPTTNGFRARLRGG